MELCAGSEVDRVGKRKGGVKEWRGGQCTGARRWLRRRAVVSWKSASVSPTFSPGRGACFSDWQQERRLWMLSVDAKGLWWTIPPHSVWRSVRIRPSAVLFLFFSSWLLFSLILSHTHTQRLVLFVKNVWLCMYGIWYIMVFYDYLNVSLWYTLRDITGYLNISLL